jgi:hypothetical protein
VSREGWTQRRVSLQSYKITGNVLTTSKKLWSKMAVLGPKFEKNFRATNVYDLKEQGESTITN